MKAPKYIFAAIVALALLMNLFSCTNAAKKEQSAETWTGEMQDLAMDVKALLPYLYDKEAFSAPDNRERVQHYLNHFANGVHQISPEMAKGLTAQDPLVQYSLDNLKGDLQRAANSYQQGHFDYSRSVTKASLNHCFSCHSVTDVGSSARWNLEDVTSLKLAPLEKADLLVATRKYDKALTYMEELINSEQFLKTRTFDFESLLRKYLALMIRIQADPKRALAEMDKVAANPNTPHYVLDQINGWRRSLKAWVQEKPVPRKRAGKTLELAKERFQKAKKLQQFEKDHAGDVEYLRATAILHDGLGGLKKPADQAQALFMLGNAYEVLDELGSWNLHETYYEYCVLKAPKSPPAKNCFQRLEDSVSMGYSGSAGVNIPPEERERLDKLRSML
jgi:hypothetical protein